MINHSIISHNYSLRYFYSLLFSLESWEDIIRSKMELGTGDDPPTGDSGDHLESVKRDSDSDPPPDEGKLNW